MNQLHNTHNRQGGDLKFQSALGGHCPGDLWSPCEKNTQHYFGQWGVVCLRRGRRSSFTVKTTQPPKRSLFLGLGGGRRKQQVTLLGPRTNGTSPVSEKGGNGHMWNATWVAGRIFGGGYVGSPAKQEETCGTIGVNRTQHGGRKWPDSKNNEKRQRHTRAPRDKTWQMKSETTKSTRRLTKKKT